MDPADVAPPIVDGRYEVRAELGRGSFGVVYAAEDVGLAREVALKMLASEWTRDERLAASLQREARALASVRSPHVVQVFAFGRHRDQLYFAMERVRGRSLADIIEDHTAAGASVPLGRALRILEQVAEGISAVHAAGLLHLDVKPENIMIEDETGRPVLVDFGLATRVRDGSEPWGGTPGFMPPEQARLTDDPVTERADVYGLGCTAYNLLSGVPPFAVGAPALIFYTQVNGPLPRLGALRPDLQHLDPVIERSLASQPAERHESCAAFVRELAARAVVWSEAPTVAPPPAPPPRPAEPAGLTLLVVDPDPDGARLSSSAARIALFGKRLHVDTAPGAAEALALATARTPDLVILRCDAVLIGLDILTALRRLPSGAGMRVIVLSGPEGLRIGTFRFSILGVKHFLPVPTSLQALVDTIGTIAHDAGWRDRRDEAREREARR